MPNDTDSPQRIEAVTGPARQLRYTVGNNVVPIEQTMRPGQAAQRLAQSAVQLGDV